MSTGRKAIVVPKKLAINVDTREKTPVLFPKSMLYYPRRDSRSGRLINVRTNRKQLGIGDYRLESYPTVCVIERKGSVDELGKNLLSDDYERFTRALDRLADGCLHPVMFLDDSVPNFYKPTSRFPLPGPIIDGLIRECVERSITMLWAGRLHGKKSRYLLGETLVRVMLAYAFAQRDLDQEDILKKMSTRS